MFCFCLFKVLLQMVKDKWIGFCKAFSRFEIFSPCFKCFSFDKTKLPLKETLLLVFKRVLMIRIEMLFSPPFELKKIPIEKYSWKTLIFEIGGGAVLLLWAHVSPFLAWIAKNGIIRALEGLSSPLVINKWVKIIPKAKSFSLMLISPQRIESCLEWWRSMSYGVEAFVFAEDSNSLLIYLWLGLKYSWKTH
jgi:hypothetical protein